MTTDKKDADQQREFKYRANRRVLHMEACIRKALEVIRDVESDYGADNLGLSVMVTETETLLNLALDRKAVEKK